MASHAGNSAPRATNLSAHWFATAKQPSASELSPAKTVAARPGSFLCMVDTESARLAVGEGPTPPTARTRANSQNATLSLSESRITRRCPPIKSDDPAAAPQRASTTLHRPTLGNFRFRHGTTSMGIGWHEQEQLPCSYLLFHVACCAGFGFLDTDLESALMILGTTRIRQPLLLNPVSKVNWSKLRNPHCSTCDINANRGSVLVGSNVLASSSSSSSGVFLIARPNPVMNFAPFLSTHFFPCVNHVQKWVIFVRRRLGPSEMSDNYYSPCSCESVACRWTLLDLSLLPSPEKRLILAPTPPSPPWTLTIDLLECQQLRHTKTTQFVFLLKASPAECWRRLHKNTAHAQLKVQRWGVRCLRV